MSRFEVQDPIHLLDIKSNRTYCYLDTVSNYTTLPQETSCQLCFTIYRNEFFASVFKTKEEMKEPLHLLRCYDNNKTVCGKSAKIVSTINLAAVDCDICIKVSQTTNFPEFVIPNKEEVKMDNKRTTTTNIQLLGHTTADELRRMIEDIPDNAILSVSSYKGDQREPGYTTLTFTW